jgi:hypothetical protein
MMQSYCYRQAQVKVQDDLVMFTALNELQLQEFSFADVVSRKLLKWNAL